GRPSRGSNMKVRAATAIANQKARTAPSPCPFFAPCAARQAPSPVLWPLRVHSTSTFPATVRPLLRTGNRSRVISLCADSTSTRPAAPQSGPPLLLGALVLQTP